MIRLPSMFGLGEEALALLERGRRLDPLSLSISHAFTANYLFMQDYGSVIKEAERGLQIQPDHWMLVVKIGQAYSFLGQHEEAQRYALKALTLSHGNVSAQGALGRIYARSGENDQAHDVLATLLEKSQVDYVQPFLVAKLYFYLGEPDEGFLWLQKAVDEMDQSVCFALVDPDYDMVRSDPRFSDILRQLGLPLQPYSRAVQEEINRALAAQPPV